MWKEGPTTPPTSASSTLLQYSKSFCIAATISLIGLPLALYPINLIATPLWSSDTPAFHKHACNLTLKIIPLSYRLVPIKLTFKAVATMGTTLSRLAQTSTVSMMIISESKTA
jgi:hypothetical protein